MTTPQQVKSDRIVFKIGSYEWLIHYGLAIGLITLGFIGVYDIVKDIVAERQIDSVYLTFHLPILLLGLIAYWIQSQKLIFRTLCIQIEAEKNRGKIEDLLKNAGWEIEISNKGILIASYDGQFCDEELILKYNSNTILWTAINHPGNHNSFASQLSRMSKAKKLVTEIREVCA